jgi:hypothetical protein
MSEAARLRAQMVYSTDPDYLERMALAEEAREKRRPAGRETTQTATLVIRVAIGEQRT